MPRSPSSGIVIGAFRSIFVFFYFDEKEANILKLLVVFVRAKIRFRFFTQFQTLQKNNNTSFYDSKYLESLASNDSCPF